MIDLATLDDWLATREAAVPHLRDGCGAHIVWSGEAGHKTALSVVFIHGFSASCGELRPLPETIASHLQANLFLVRLNGHGQDGAAMGEATLDAWRRDVAEALEIADALGDETLVIGCSTGCTLATLALADGAQIKGLIQISPNYGLAHKAAQFLLDLPMSEKWGHLIAGSTRSFPVLNDGHRQFWTTTYPSKAAHPMAQAVRAVRRADLGRVTVPTFAAVNEKDQVVSAEATTKTLSRWGGPVTRHPLIQTEHDDAMGHIMAGDIFSPQQTEPLARRIIDWIGAL